MPAAKLLRGADCTTALALLLALGTACASKARTADQPALAPPLVAAAQPSTPATTTPPAAALPAPTSTEAAAANQPAARPASPAAQPEEPVSPPAAQAAAADPKMPAGLPADHVKDKDGVMHKRGYKRPFGDCTSCHGKDLRGEGKAPSCYQCHGKEWH